ncbi:MAG: mechanosensitive ion channel [Oscillospiraceae bacterium]|nr:mechanosensitive ion channel [Oscillospiraceae bacterium]MDO4973682.1 mechanosensitive ion channel [Eubacteriales bacterium]
MNQVLSAMGISSVNALVSALVTLLICIIAIKIITNIVNRLLERSPRLDATLRHYISSGVRTLLWILAVIIVANALGINTTSLVALVSVAGLALSLSVQNVMSNLFSGITLLIAKPFSSGDFVEVAGKTGIVKAVGLFYTQLDTLDNIAVSIPNSDVTAGTVNNYSREPLRRVDRTFTASYECPTEDVKAAIASAISKDERILSDPAPFVRLLEYKGSTVEYVVRVWCKNADYWDVYFNLNENVREAFAEKGVKFSYEHVNVHIVEK